MPHRLVRAVAALGCMTSPLAAAATTLHVGPGQAYAKPCAAIAAAGTGDSGFAASGHTTFLHATPATRGADMVFRVNGDSMEPKYPDHCNVLVKFTDEPLGSGDIGIFQVDGALYIKQYQSDGLHSLNKHFKIMRRKSYDEIKTIGRVIGILPDSDFATSAEIQDFQAQESQN